MQIKLRKIVEVSIKDLMKEVENILIKKCALAEDEFLAFKGADSTCSNVVVESTLTFEVKSNSSVKI